MKVEEDKSRNDIIWKKMREKCLTNWDTTCVTFHKIAENFIPDGDSISIVSHKGKTISRSGSNQRYIPHAIRKFHETGIKLPSHRTYCSKNISRWGSKRHMLHTGKKCYSRLGSNQHHIPHQSKIHPSILTWDPYSYH